MIGSLSGPVSYKGAGYVIVDCGGIGYRVFVTAAAYQKIGLGKEATLFTHLAIRDDTHTLYGFETPDELSFFELLLTVSGIGPKSALAILSIDTATSLQSAITYGDSAYLTKVSGIGRKNAEKIILELKDKLGGAEEKMGHARQDSEVLDALSALGYGLHEAREALKRIPPDTEKTSERLKAALKELGTRQ